MVNLYVALRSFSFVAVLCREVETVQEQTGRAVPAAASGFG